MQGTKHNFLLSRIIMRGIDHQVYNGNTIDSLGEANEIRTFFSFRTSQSKNERMQTREHH